MFFAFTYASYDDLGWDDTMVLHWDGDTPQYDITVQPFPIPTTADSPGKNPNRVRTKGLLSGVGAEHLRGRGARVWSINEFVDGKVGKEAFILKVPG